MPMSGASSTAPSSSPTARSFLLVPSRRRPGVDAVTTSWHRAIRDFEHESTRTILVVLAIAVGIVGFAAVFAFYAIVTSEMNTLSLHDALPFSTDRAVGELD